MFGSSALDVALGLVFLYLLLSLLCTAINEVLEAAVQKRGEYLRYGIAELLGVAPNVSAGTWAYQLAVWVLARVPRLLSWLSWALSGFEWLYVWFRSRAGSKKGTQAVGTAGAGAPTHLFRLATWLGTVGTDPPLNNALLARVYTHPLIASLYSGTFGTDAVRLPAYIPARQFALALLDTVLPAGATGSGAAFAVAGAGSDPEQGKEHIQRLREAVRAAGNGLTDEVRRALLALIDAAGNDMDRIRAGIEQWYNGTMDRVAGWYRRRVQYVSVAVGALMAVALNADTFAIADSLARDQVLRATVASAAESYAKAHAPADAQAKADEQKAADVKAALGNVSKGVNEVRGFGWPLGWDFADDRTVLPDPLRELARPADRASYQWSLWGRWVWDWRAAGGWFIKALGWVLTAAAISLGAPFWFDILNRLIVIRSTVKPTEKSPDEPSADKK